MNLKYMVLKERYKFVYIPTSILNNSDDSLNISKEIMLFLKQLSLYGTSLKALIKNRPDINVKNELLNIAYLCKDNDALFQEIKKRRVLPLKLICSLTGKPSSFIIRWESYITAYTILLSNNTYSNMREFLSIYNSSSRIKSKDEKVETISNTLYTSKIQTGVVLKVLGKGFYVLTPYGDFLKLNLDGNSRIIGEICTSEIKRELNIPKFPFILTLIGLISIALLCAILYMQPKRTLIIDTTFSITLKLNYLNKTIEVQPLGKKAIPIVESIKLFNHSLDDSILVILEKAKDTNLISKDTKISMFITGTKKTTLKLTKTEAFIHNNNLKVFINNNGVEHIMEK